MGESSKLPYNLDKLTWDSAHHFNAQNKYSYTGKGRRLGDPMLQCESCLQWFFSKDVGCLPKEGRFVAFQRNYRFSCRICASGTEQFSLLTNSWSAVVVTALHNLQLPLELKNSEVMEVTSRSPVIRKWVSIDEIIEWIRNHWGSLCHGRSITQLEGNAVRKCLAHMEYVINMNQDKTGVSLKSFHPTRLLMKPMRNMTVSASAALPAKPKKERESAGANKRKRNSAPTRRPPAELHSTPVSEIKLPEKYRLIPAPKMESQPQDASVVQLSRSMRAPQIVLGEGLMSAVGYKGFRMVRATHGVRSGSWYFEVRVSEPLNDEDGHTRLGWCTEMGELQAPVGFDVNSYSYRDIGGMKFHESLGAQYGASYGPGDVIGCHLRMGDPAGSAARRQRITIKGQEYVVEEERPRVASVGSSISFFKNGKPQGVAFTDVWAEVYYPAVSLFKAASVTCNFGPTFAFPPEGLDDFRPMSELPSTLLPPPTGAPAATGESSANGMFGAAEGLVGSLNEAAGVAAGCGEVSAGSEAPTEGGSEGGAEGCGEADGSEDSAEDVAGVEASEKDTPMAEADNGGS